jgi:hypothetical protein
MLLQNLTKIQLEQNATYHNRIAHYLGILLNTVEIQHCINMARRTNANYSLKNGYDVLHAKEMPIALKNSHVYEYRHGRRAFTYD